MIFQGLTPGIFAAISDSIGRRPTYMICFIVYIAANIGLAVTDTYWLLMLLRAIQATGNSATVALGRRRHRRYRHISRTRRVPRLLWRRSSDRSVARPRHRRCAGATSRLAKYFLVFGDIFGGFYGFCSLVFTGDIEEYSGEWECKAKESLACQID